MEQCLLGLLGLLALLGLFAPLGLPSNDTALIAATLPLLLTPSTLPIVATLPLLLKNICSKRWCHCPETIVSKGTGTRSVAVGKV